MTLLLDALYRFGQKPNAHSSGHSIVRFLIYSTPITGQAASATIKAFCRFIVKFDQRWPLWRGPMRPNIRDKHVGEIDLRRAGKTWGFASGCLAIHARPWVSPLTEGDHRDSGDRGAKRVQLGEAVANSGADGTICILSNRQRTFQADRSGESDRNRCEHHYPISSASNSPTRLAATFCRDRVLAKTVR
jgi:hypothetical protein